MYSPESSVRKTGSYIYEEFMPTDGTDVKVQYCRITLLKYTAASSRSMCSLNTKIQRKSVFLMKPGL